MKRMRQGSEYMEAVADLRNKPELQRSIEKITFFKKGNSNDETINIFLKFFDDLDELIVEATEEYE
jgi:hypothetical protein